MKLMDKKGRLFGIVSIMDLLIIIVVIAIGFVGYTKFIKEPSGNSGAQSNKKEIYIVAEAYRQDANVVASIKEGDELVSKNKYQEGKIEYVEIRDNDYVATDKDGNLIAAKNPLEKTIEVGITCQANVSGPYIDSGNQEIKVGLGYYIKTSKGEIHGVVKEIRLDE